MKRMMLISLLAAAFTSLSSAQWTSGQAATFVVGQPNMTTSSPECSATKLTNPFGVAIDLENGKLYVADTWNFRIVRFSYPITSSSPSAEAVFGQPDMTTHNEFMPPTDSTLSVPIGLSVYDDVLWVCDQWNNRVLRYDNASTKQTGAKADGVLGQSDFNSDSPTTTASGMYYPTGCAITPNGTLWVADNSNYRVLRFDNAASKLNGAVADGVLGQRDFVHMESTLNDSTGGQPNGVVMDGAGRLWVSYAENRVLRFDNAAAKWNGAPANGVLGQPDFTSSLNATSQSGLNYPIGLAVDYGRRLYIADASNNRVVIHNEAALKAPGASADFYLGQSEWDDSNTGAANPTDMFYPASVAVDTANNFLVVADQQFSRVLILEATGLLPVQLTAFTVASTGLGVTLAWSTATEGRNAGFAIERRTSGTPWKEIAFVAGAGTSNSPHEYVYVDVPPGSGEFLYRLKQVDHDGAFSYHHELAVVVEAPEKVALGQNYPNPFNPTTVIRYQSSTMGPVNLKVFDLLGREVATLVNEVQSPGIYSVSFDASSLPSGSYIYSLRIGTQSVSRMMTLLR